MTGMFSLFRALISGCLILLTSGPSLAAAQSLSVSSAGGDSSRYKLEGTVVNPVTGMPLSRALVEIMGSGHMTMTGPDGRFEFGDLPPGQVVVLARKPGYYGARNETRRYGSYITVELGPQSTPMTIKLLPESVIAGHVENSEGEPVEGALVRVLTPLMKSGRRQWIPLSQAVTDEDGNFRVASLFTSRFQVEVQANRARNLSKEGYPAVIYYPGVPDLAAAQPLEVGHGRQLDLQFLIKREPVFKISGTIAGAEGDDMNVRLRTRSGEDVVLARSVSRPGTFEISSVPAGAYVVEGRTRRNKGVNLYGELPVNVTGNTSGLRLTVGPVLPVPITARAESATPSPESATDAATVERSLRVQFRSLDSAFRDNQSSFEMRDNSPVLEARDLLPGSYAVEVNAWGRWYAQSARSGSVNLLREPLVVPGNGHVPPIDLLLRDDGATVSGTVKAPSPEAATVLIVPDFAPMQTPLTLNPDHAGHFSAVNLAPGSYKIYAFDSVEQLEYANPLVLREYDARSARVNLSAAGAADVSLDLIQLGE